MLFRTYGQAVLTLHERHSRLIVAARPQGKASALVADAMCELLSGLPPEWRQTVTFDNGTEFARHYQLHELGIDTFFCDTYSPWQKGGVENAIGRLRRMLPRKTDLANVSDERFTQLVQIYNNTPRKCLGYYTPAEILSKQLLHLKCESTFPRRREGGFAVGIGEAVLDQVLGCVHSVADFDAGGFAAHGVGEEGGDVVAVFGDAVYVVLQLG